MRERIMNDWYALENAAKGRAIAARLNEALHEAAANQMVPVFTDLETETLWRMSGGTWLEYDTETRVCALEFRQALPSSYLVCWRMLGWVRHDPALGTTMDDATPEEEARWAARWPIYVLTDAGRSHLEARMKDVTWVRFGDTHVWRAGTGPYAERGGMWHKIDA
jgi:hypothetical protein